VLKEIQVYGATGAKEITVDTEPQAATGAKGDYRLIRELQVQLVLKEIQVIRELTGSTCSQGPAGPADSRWYRWCCRPQGSKQVSNRSHRFHKEAKE